MSPDEKRARKSEAQKIWRHANMELVRKAGREYKREWRAEHPDHYDKYMKEYLANWRAKNREHINLHARKYTTGWSAEDFETAWAEQAGKCAICGTAMVRRGKRFAHADHNHNTGKKRRLLCAGCNLRLGHIEKDPSWLTKALEYIWAHG